MALEARQNRQTAAKEESLSVLETTKTPQGAARTKALSAIDPLLNFFRDDATTENCRSDERAHHPRHKKVLAQIRRQNWIILFLTVLMIVTAPFLKPLHIHQTIEDNVQRSRKGLVALTEPNLTDQAILNWSVTSITEILTFGFGDYDQRILAQKKRFTSDGWRSFVDVLLRKNWRNDFKAGQLVLTTVPADEPVIITKGIDQDEDYIWTVEMPIVMTFATNNDKKKVERHIVRLVIMRVPSSQNVLGMGIKAWFMM